MIPVALPLPTSPPSRYIFIVASGAAPVPPVKLPHLTSLAPQLLVADLSRSIAFYQKLGFTFGEPWEGFYAIGTLDGFELHLKESPANPAERAWRRQQEHLDAAAGVDGIEAFYDHCVANGVTILRSLAPTEWGTKDFYVEDPDGHVMSFGGTPARGG